MNFQFLADNDPCGLYKDIDTVKEKVIFSRNASDRTEEYCNVRTETEGLNGQKDIKEYIVRKSSLVKPEEWEKWKESNNYINDLNCPSIP